jgi:hypothetical protein
MCRRLRPRGQAPLRFDRELDLRDAHDTSFTCRA